MSFEVIERQVGKRTFQLTQGMSNSGEVQVYETTGDEITILTGVIDLPKLSSLTDEVLVSLASTRKQSLVRLMGEYNILSGVDYDHEDLYEILYSASPVGRFAAVTGDQTYHFLEIFETIPAALGSLASDVNDQANVQYPRYPIEIRDLDTGFTHGVRIQATVVLND